MAITVNTKALFAAIEARVKTLASSIRIAWQNETFKPTTGAMYLRINRIPAHSRLLSYGGKHVRETGILQVTVVSPAGTGNGASDALADTIRNGFQPGSEYTNSSVTVQVLDFPSVAPPLNSQDWVETPVSIPYTADFFG